MSRTDIPVVPAGQAQLFLDDELIEGMHNVERVWHGLPKHPLNPLMVRSGLEDGIYLFGTVIRELDPLAGGDPVFRMWYYAVGRGTRWVAYARSLDGLRWDKPDLGILRLGGENGHNAVFCPEGWRMLGLSGVVRSERSPEGERYKLMIPASAVGTGEKAYLQATSPDGFHWRLVRDFTPGDPCKPDRACFVWDPFVQAYALYNRGRYDHPHLRERGGPAYWGRAIALCRSPDFVNWSRPEMVMHAEDDDPDGTELYGMAAFPYEGQWIGLVQIHRSLPHLAHIDVAIAHSRDGRTWRREKDLVLPRGGTGEWDRFNQCASTAPVRVGDECWIYYSGRLYRHGEYKNTDLTDSGPREVGIGLATIRADGWCSLQASFDGGEVLTKMLRLPDAEDIYVNAKSDWGELVVEVLEQDAEPIAAMRSDPISADGTRLRVKWAEGGSLRSIDDSPIRLRFLIKNALLYSWKAE